MVVIGVESNRVFRCEKACLGFRVSSAHLLSGKNLIALGVSKFNIALSEGIRWG
jgi:hypothetical protein